MASRGLWAVERSEKEKSKNLVSKAKLEIAAKQRKAKQVKAK